MKSAVSLAAVVCLFVFSIMFPVFAQTYDDFQYSSDGSSITVTGYTGSGGDVVIPATINGLPVTRIGTNAFVYCHGITSIDIPDGILFIADHAFFECIGLASLEIPDSVSYIGEWAFASCYGLSDIVIPDSVVSIGSYTFYNCLGLENAVIGSGIPLMPEAMFYSCSSLTNVVIGNSVTSIMWAAFAYCDNLTDIVIPDGVISLEGATFSDCYSLEGVYFCGDAPALGINAFRNDTNIIYRLAGMIDWPAVGELWGGRPTALWDTNPSSLFNSISILRSLEADGPALFEVDVAAPTGKTITVTVPTDPAAEYDLTEDDAGEYEYYDPSMMTDPLSTLEAQYPQGDYVLRLYSDETKTTLEETLTVSFSDGNSDPLPFPEVYPALTQPVPSGGQIHAVPEQTYTWDSYSGATGTATHMYLEITGTGESDGDIAEYDAEIDGSCSFTPPSVSFGDYDLELCFFFRQSGQTAGGTLIECANERYSKYALTVSDSVYQLTVNSGTGSGSYTNGAVVSITASNAPDGQVFDQWTGAMQYVANVFAAATTVAMPAQDIAVTAAYKTALSDGKSILDFRLASANSGNLVNGPVWATGRYGNGLGLGNGQYVSVPAPSPDIFNITGDLTLSMWVNPNSVTCSGIHPAYALLSSRSSNHQHPYVLCILNGGQLYFEYSGTYISWPSFTSTSALTTGTWQHVLVTRSLSGNDATVTFYIDGVESGCFTVTSGPALGSSDPVWIARDGYFTSLTSQGSYSGLLDEVQIYNRALSSQEVSRVFANDSALLPNRVGNWRFDEASGSVATDTIADGVVNKVSKSVTVPVPEGTDVTALVPLIVTSPLASVAPASGVPGDFTLPVTYTVTAEDLTTQDYIVTVFPVAEYLLTVNNGSGGGAYTNGAVVDIEAAAAPEGQVFDCWTGATQYVANVFAASTTVAMPAQDIAVTATYRSTVAAMHQDGFEAPEIDPYWVESLQNGTIAPSTAQAHGGTQSMRFAAPWGGQKYLHLRHFFDEPQWGTVTVWVYDSLEYIYFNANLENSVSGTTSVNINVQDWDTSAYYFNHSMTNWAGGKSSVPRVGGWRKFTLRNVESELVLSVDGQELFRGPSEMPFDTIRLTVSGPGGGTIYFDDFSFIPDAVGDADTDDLPDAWEARYFGDLESDPQALCANGVNTVMEAYIAGLDPVDPVSLFTVKTGGRDILEWSGVSGRVYSVWWTTNLLNSFQCLESNISWTAGGYTDAVHNAESKGFYKIDVRLQ